MQAQGSKTRPAQDSPRWCDFCQRWGDHHYDRCPIEPRRMAIYRDKDVDGAWAYLSNEHQRAMKRIGDLEETLREALEKGNALSGDIAELVGIYGIEDDHAKWEDPVERAVYRRQREWLDLASHIDTALFVPPRLK